MAPPVPTASRGVIRGPHDPASRPDIAHAQYRVEAPLNASIEHWWSVAWRLAPGDRHEARTLPHPCVHVVAEGERVRVMGVMRGRFTRVLEGEGAVFGAKFLPGAFRPLLRVPMASLTDKVLDLADVLGATSARRYRQALGGCSTDEQRVAAATAFFLEVLPPPSSDASLLRALVDAAAHDRSVTSVEALCARSGLHVRELQRLFRDAVGIAPKWMIQRYRLHEALDALEAGGGSLAEIAAALGYADQAHFARDFKALVGVSPSQYARSLRVTSA
jgi:AraC-like DNA-binding protein